MRSLRRAATALCRAVTAWGRAATALRRAATARGRAATARGRAAPILAVVLAAVMLAACTGGRPAGSSSSARARPPGAQARRAALGFRDVKGQARITISGPGGRGGGPIFIGPGGPGGFFVLSSGPGGGSGRPHISVAPIPPAGSAQTVALPLDSYEQVSVQEQDALAAADDQLTQRCMAAAGFSYPVAAEPGDGGVTVQGIEDGGYGVTSLAQAETYGYRQPSHGAGSAGPGNFVIPASVGVQNKHGTAWTSALLGFVPGARANAPQHQGCLQAANTELYGKISGNPDPDPVPQITIQAAQWTQSDPRILAVQRAWSACMARSGLAYKTPAQAEEHDWPSTPTPAEITTAVADVRCKTRTNLVNTWLTVEAAYQQALIGQNLTSLSRLQTSFGALQRRAEALLQLPAATGILRISRGRISRRNLQVIRGRK